MFFFHILYSCAISRSSIWDDNNGLLPPAEEDDDDSAAAAAASPLCVSAMLPVQEKMSRDRSRAVVVHHFFCLTVIGIWRQRTPREVSLL